MDDVQHDVSAFRLGRTSREAALLGDIKSLVREIVLAEVRDDLYEWVREMDAEEGVIPTVDDLIDRIHRDRDDGSQDSGSASV